MKMEDATKKLDPFFAYRIDKLANDYGYEVTIWDEYSLSSTVRDGNLDVAVNYAIFQFTSGDRK